MIVYTDGSCSPNPGKGGWGYIVLDRNIQFEASGRSDYTTNNIMEMTAVIQFLNDFKNCNDLTIYSDSLYVINCAQGIWQRKKNVELWKEYDKLAKNKKIKYIWIKGHNGDYYNERVDKLAKGIY